MNVMRVGTQMFALLIAGGLAAGAFAQAPGHGHGHGGAPEHGPGMAMHGSGGAGYGPARGMGMGMGPGATVERLEHMARALGLSEDQRAQVAGIFEDTRRKNWDAIGQIRSERYRLREMMRGDTVDPDAAVELKRKIDDLGRQVMRARLAARNQVLALLTPEQREKARTFGPRR